MFKNLFILKVSDLCALRDFILCYKYENNLLPDFFIMCLHDDFHHEHLTRARGKRRIPAVRHEFARQSLIYRFPKSFNSMPTDVVDKIYTHSLIGFKLYIKKRIINDYHTRCSIPDCFICNS